MPAKIWAKTSSHVSMFPLVLPPADFIPPQVSHSLTICPIPYPGHKVGNVTVPSRTCDSSRVLVTSQFGRSLNTLRRCRRSQTRRCHLTWHRRRHSSLTYTIQSSWSPSTRWPRMRQTSPSATTPSSSSGLPSSPPTSWSVISWCQ